MGRKAGAARKKQKMQRPHQIGLEAFENGLTDDDSGVDVAKVALDVVSVGGRSADVKVVVDGDPAEEVLHPVRVDVDGVRNDEKDFEVVDHLGGHEVEDLQGRRSRLLRGLEGHQVGDVARLDDLVRGEYENYHLRKVQTKFLKPFEEG